MATTDFGALSAAQKKVWAAETWQAGRDQSFFFSQGFIGKSDTDMNAVIQRVTKLTETERGLECVMQLVQDLQSDGVVGDNDLEGNEEAMINDAITIRIDQLRHGVKSKGEISEQATVIRFRATGKEKLGFWLSDKLDELMFLTLSGRAYTLKTDGTTRSGSNLPTLSFAADVAAPSSNRILHAGSATSEATITSADKMQWSTIVNANTRAAEKRIRPIRSGGKEYYAMVIHPRQRRDLVLDPTYQTILRTAEKPGGDHPLLKGAIATVDGVVIYAHNKVFNTSGLAGGSKWGAAGAVDGAQAMLLGAQAGGVALLGNVFWRESDNTDYGNKQGIGVGRKIGMLKPRFKSIFDANTLQDFGTLAVKTAAAAQ
jgi:N4-gp56 family major capsid protein